MIDLESCLPKSFGATPYSTISLKVFNAESFFKALSLIL